MIKSIKDKNGIIEKLSYFIFSIYIITLFANSTAIYLEYDYVGKAIKLVRYGCYLFFAIKSICLFIKEKNISINNVIFLIIGILVLVLGKNPELLIVFFIVNSARDLELKKIAKIGLIIYAVLFAITVILSYFGILPNWMYYRQELKRYSLGFIYPTDLMSVYVTITLLYFYVRNTKAKYIELVILEAIAIALFSFTNGRLGLIMVTMILLLLALIKIISDTKLADKIKINSIKLKKVLAFLIKCIPIILLIGSVLISVLYQYNIEIINKINYVISERISLNSRAFTEYPIKLFGSDVTWNGLGGKYNVSVQDYNYVDMSYVRIIFDYGIIGAIFILYAYIDAIEHCIEKDEKWILACILIILVWSIIEPVIFSMSRNLFLIYLGNVLASNPNKKLLSEGTRREV